METDSGGFNGISLPVEMLSCPSTSISRAGDGLHQRCNTLFAGGGTTGTCWRPVLTCPLLQAASFHVPLRPSRRGEWTQGHQRDIRELVSADLLFGEFLEGFSNPVHSLFQSIFGFQPRLIKEIPFASDCPAGRRSTRSRVAPFSRQVHVKERPILKEEEKVELVPLHGTFCIFCLHPPNPTHAVQPEQASVQCHPSALILDPCGWLCGSEAAEQSLSPVAPLSPAKVHSKDKPSWASTCVCTKAHSLNYILLVLKVPPDPNFVLLIILILLLPCLGVHWRCQSL